MSFSKELTKNGTLSSTRHPFTIAAILVGVSETPGCTTSTRPLHAHGLLNKGRNGSKGVGGFLNSVGTGSIIGIGKDYAALHNIFIIRKRTTKEGAGTWSKIYGNWIGKFRPPWPRPPSLPSQKRKTRWREITHHIVKSSKNYPKELLLFPLQTYF